jgi:hypothetical protein
MVRMISLFDHDLKYTLLVTINEQDNNLPPLIKDLPVKATRIIINWMNYRKTNNNWEELAMRIWPEMTDIDYGFFEENGKTKAILKRWGVEGGKTKDLLSILQDMDRKDVLVELEKQYPSIR